MPSNKQWGIVVLLSILMVAPYPAHGALSIAGQLTATILILAGMAWFYNSARRKLSQA